MLGEQGEYRNSHITTLEVTRLKILLTHAALEPPPDLYSGEPCKGFTAVAGSYRFNGFSLLRDGIREPGCDMGHRPNCNGVRVVTVTAWVHR